MPRKTAAAAAQLCPATPELFQLPLNLLYLHPLNPRKEPPEPEIEALAQSIRAAGLLQNLLGYSDPQIEPGPDGGTVGIVAGGRRLRALALLAERGQWDGPVPVLVTTFADMAKEWAGAENESHQPLAEADRIIAYRQMREAGASIEAIASAFAKPVSDVRRQLALATLPDAAIEALRDGRIGHDVAKILTIARSPEDQDAALQLALATNAPAWKLREMLHRDAVTARDRLVRFVGLDAYHAAGGTSTTDLFGDEQTILHDAGLINRLAAEKGGAAIAELAEAEGWARGLFTSQPEWRTVDDEGLTRIWGEKPEMPEADAARMAELSGRADLTPAEDQELMDLERRADMRIFTDAERASAGILGFVTVAGQMTVTRAYRRKGDRATSGAVGEDDIDLGPTSPEPSMPQNLKDDLRAIRLICIQDALRRDPDLCQSLLAMQLAGIFAPWNRPFAFDTRPGHRHPFAPPPAKADGFHVPRQLQDSEAGEAQEDWSVAKWAAENAGQTGQMVLNGLARAFCRVDGPLVDAIHAAVPVTPRALWTPTAAGFLSRVSVGYLDALWRDLVPEDAATSARDGFFGLTKKDKARQLEKLFGGHDLRELLGLSRDDNARIDAWLPEELRFATAEQESDK